MGGYIKTLKPEERQKDTAGLCLPVPLDAAGFGYFALLWTPKSMKIIFLLLMGRICGVNFNYLYSLVVR